MHRSPAITLKALLEQLATDETIMRAAVETLVAEGKLSREGDGGDARLTAVDLFVPVGAELRWEVAVFDHFRAVVNAIAAKVRRGRGRSQGDDVVGGATLSFDVGPDAFLRQVNQAVFIDVAIARPDAVAVDQLPDFLGHGHNANVTGCPHGGEDNSQWIETSHPNALGQAHIAEKWKVALSSMLGPQCRDQ